MDWVQELILRYSYWAIMVGVVLEGDLTLLVAGMMAHEKLLGFGFGTTFLAAMVGAVAGDVATFVIGRYVRESICSTAFYKKFNPRLEWLDQKFGAVSIVLVKYIYGLRWASSVFWGVSRMGPMRFMMLTLMSCFIWVAMLTGLGYLFGEAVTAFIGRHGAMPVSLGLTFLAAFSFWAIHHYYISPLIDLETEKAGLTHDLEALPSPALDESLPVDSLLGGSEPMPPTVPEDDAQTRIVPDDDGPDTTVSQERAQV